MMTNEQETDEILLNSLFWHTHLQSFFHDRARQIYARLDPRIQTQFELYEFFLHDGEVHCRGDLKPKYQTRAAHLAQQILTQGSDFSTHQELHQLIRKNSQSKNPDYVAFLSRGLIPFSNKGIRMAVLLISQSSLELAAVIPILNENRSILEALAGVFLGCATQVLSNPIIAGVNYTNSYSNLEILKKSGARLMAWLFTALYSKDLYTRLRATAESNEYLEDLETQLYDIFCFISWMKNEKRDSKGRIVFGSSKMFKDSAHYIDMRFQHPIQISAENIKRLRKVLDISSRARPLYCQIHDVLGLGREIPLDRDDIFCVDFTGGGSWELSYKDQAMMRVHNSLPTLPQAKLDEKAIRAKLRSIFDKVTPESVERLTMTLLAASEQTHGSIIVISTEARDEAHRLRARSMPTEPVAPTVDIIQQVSAMDGALLMDDQGILHAVGVILDGDIAENSHADSSRGARYNSSITYVEFRRRANPEARCLALIVSEDGIVSFYPA
jgi:hypothetical protein